VRRLASLLAVAAVAILAACGVADTSNTTANRSALSGSGLLQMLNTREGWTYGNDLVARTTDGARTFANVTPPGAGGDSQLVDPFFLDSSHAWIWLIRWNQSSLASAVLDRTTNGGSSWTSIPFQPAVEGGMTFVDPEHGWMISGREVANHTAVENTLWRTSDGGQTWRQAVQSTHRLDIEPNVQKGDCYWLGQVAWTSLTHGVAGVSCPNDAQPAVEVTYDGGSTWRLVTLPALPPRGGIALFEDVTQIHSFGGGRLAAFVSRCVGADGRSCYPYGALYRSSDGGIGWTAGVVVERGSRLLMPDPDHAWMPDACVTSECDGGELLVTSDGGVHWQQLPLPRALWPNMHGSRNYSVVTPTLGFVVASNGMARTTDYYETVDGGRTFVRFEPRFLNGARR
jgi:photosystem II stability/assembly factor-like uncharacterized protein